MRYHSLIPAAVILALGVGSVWSFGLVFALGGPAIACFYGLYAPRWLHRGRHTLPQPVPVAELAEAASSAAIEPRDDAAEQDRAPGRRAGSPRASRSM